MTDNIQNGEGVEASIRQKIIDQIGEDYDRVILTRPEWETICHSLAREPATADVERNADEAHRLACVLRIAQAYSNEHGEDMIRAAGMLDSLIYLPALTRGATSSGPAKGASDPYHHSDYDPACLACNRRADRAMEPCERHRAAPSSEPAIAEGERESVKDRAITAIRAYVESAGIPSTEFDPEFIVRMMSAMMVSFHKYGRVADAYPLKFDAASDVRARMSKYRTTGNKHFLVDAANFAMIEAMHPGREAQWGTNDAADSPGRTTASGHRLVQEDNAGNRIMGETILHVPGDDA